MLVIINDLWSRSCSASGEVIVLSMVVFV